MDENHSAKLKTLSDTMKMKCENVDFVPRVSIGRATIIYWRCFLQLKLWLTFGKKLRVNRKFHSKQAMLWLVLKNIVAFTLD